MTSDNDLQPLVAATYVALADVLDALPAERWDIPSLCQGWRVREVVAHLTMPARYGEDAFMAELRADGFDFSRLSNLALHLCGRTVPAGRLHGEPLSRVG